MALESSHSIGGSSSSYGVDALDHSTGSINRIEADLLVYFSMVVKIDAAPLQVPYEHYRTAIECKDRAFALMPRHNLSQDQIKDLFSKALVKAEKDHIRSLIQG